jgi:hypothetical protein
VNAPVIAVKKVEKMLVLVEKVVDALVEVRLVVVAEVAKSEVEVRTDEEALPRVV